TTVHIEKPFKVTEVCAGDSFYLHYTVNTPFNPGNIFTVQLSDDTGGFANATGIGFYASYLPDSILCFIPAGITAGTGYRVRIIASNPADTSLSSTPIRISRYPEPITTANTPACQGSQVNIAVTSINPVTTYTWTKP